jgi:hypothetical protein
MSSIERFFPVTGAFAPDVTRTLGLAFDKACALQLQRGKPSPGISSRPPSRANAIPTS